ncbi:MAG: hypothetical protein JWN00_5621 [Actinomycetia bacterium]|nr:hypothetical protein [Actinomycetes bacterium]
MNRLRRLVGAVAGASMAVSVLAACADKDAATMTCQQYYSSGPGGVVASPSDKQDSVITTLLVQHNLDTGPVNVAKAQYNLDRYCEFGFTGPGDSTANLRIANMPAWTNK